MPLVSWDTIAELPDMAQDLQETCVPVMEQLDGIPGQKMTVDADVFI